MPADLYGRGYSDAPQTTYDSALYTTQLALLMQYVGWPRAHITGVSMVRVTRTTSLYRSTDPRRAAASPRRSPRSSPTSCTTR